MTFAYEEQREELLAQFEAIEEYFMTHQRKLKADNEVYSGWTENEQKLMQVIYFECALTGQLEKTICLAYWDNWVKLTIPFKKYMSWFGCEYKWEAANVTTTAGFNLDKIRLPIILCPDPESGNYYSEYPDSEGRIIVSRHNEKALYIDVHQSFINYFRYKNCWPEMPPLEKVS